MKILIVIPHFYRPVTFAPDGRPHGSFNVDPGRRIAALTACLRGLRTAVAPRSYVLDHSTRQARRIAADESAELDVVVCTSGENHLLGQLGDGCHPFTRLATNADPPEETLAGSCTSVPPCPSLATTKLEAV